MRRPKSRKLSAAIRPLYGTIQSPQNVPRLNSNATLGMGGWLDAWDRASGERLPVVQTKKSWRARPASKQPKAKVGAKPKWDWEDIRFFVFRELET